MDERKTNLSVGVIRNRVYKHALDKNDVSVADTNFVSTAWKKFNTFAPESAIVVPLKGVNKFIRYGDIKKGSVSYNKSSANDEYMRTVVVPKIDDFFNIHTENGSKKQYRFAPYRDNVYGAIIMPAEFFMDLCEHRPGYNLLINADIRLFNGVGSYICNLV